MSRARWWMVGAVAAVAAAIGLRVMAARTPAAPTPAPTDGADLHGDPLPLHARARLGTHRFRHEGITNLLFLPGDELLVGGGFNREIVFWDTATGERVRTLDGHRRRLPRDVQDYTGADWKRLLRDGIVPTRSDDLDQLLLVDEGRVLVSCGSSIRTWDAATGAPRLDLADHHDSRQGVAVTPDGRALAFGTSGDWHRHELVGGTALDRVPAAEQPTPPPGPVVTAAFWSDGTLRVLDVERGREIANLPVEASDTYAITRAGTSQRAWVLVRGGSLRPLDLRTGALGDGWRIESTGSVLGAHVAPDDDTLAVWTSTAHLELWRIGSHSRIWRRRMSAAVDAVAFSNDRTRIAVKYRMGGIEIVDARSGDVLTTSLGHRSWIRHVAVSPDGRSIATASSGGELRLWSAADGRCIAVLNAPPGSFRHLAFAPDGKTLRTIDSTPTARSHALPDLTIESEETLETTVRAVTPDLGRVLVHHEERLALWHAFEEEPVAVPIGLRPPLHRVHRYQPALMPDATSVIWCDEGLSLRYQSLDGRTPARTLAAKVDSNAITISPTGSHVAEYAGGLGVRIRSVADGTAIRFDAPPESERSPVKPEEPDIVNTSAVGFSADGRYLATSSGRGRIRIWALATGKLVRRFHGHRSSVSELAFAPDGSYLVSTSYDTTALVWPLDLP